ncbi:unnamed protein product [Caenorhabditis auriculariae]|uniref:Uncharacterized protein n=1 Tax=Caenorhabditis auriculariae TaxID=2777116 RepID=A0A8S1GPS2_9PELO|nr:unnamed protein product [Caenorhabditis auriculariae]
MPEKKKSSRPKKSPSSATSSLTSSDTGSKNQKEERRMGSQPSKRNGSGLAEPVSEGAEKWAEAVIRPDDHDVPSMREPIKKKMSKKRNISTGKRNPKVGPSPQENGENRRLKIKLTEGVVQDYINLEKAIHRLERKNVLKKYESQTIYSDNLKNTVEQLEAVLKELRKQTEREKSDLKNIEQPSVKDFLKQQGQWDERHKKERTEYMEAENRQETVQKELNLARINYDNALKVMEIYKQQTDNLNALYDKQDKMLEGIFGPDYASEKEKCTGG